ncbi:MAG: exodeoxyribonuclease VII small subunit [Sedimentisphaerales bacterium]|nr:exodeoxyribonuclease VII small subunit [Sedimentisphaerales bacterium]
MAENQKKTDSAKLSFEEAIKELTSIVAGIEQGQIPLETGIKQYERGMDLIKQCRAILKNAEERIEKIGENSEKTEGKS